MELGPTAVNPIAWRVPSAPQGTLPLFVPAVSMDDNAYGSSLLVPDVVLVNAGEGTDTQRAFRTVLSMVKGGSSQTSAIGGFAPTIDPVSGTTYSAVYAPPTGAICKRASMGFATPYPVDTTPNVPGALVNGANGSIGISTQYTMKIPGFDPTTIRSKENELWLIAGFNDIVATVFGANTTVWMASDKDIDGNVDNAIIAFPLSQLTAQPQASSQLVNNFAGRSLVASNISRPSLVLTSDCLARVDS